MSDALFEASLLHGDVNQLRRAQAAGYRLPEEPQQYYAVLDRALATGSVPYLVALAAVPSPMYRHWSHLLLRSYKVADDFFGQLLAETTIATAPSQPTDVSVGAVHQLVRALLVAGAWEKMRLLLNHFPTLPTMPHTGPATLLGTIIGSRLCSTGTRAQALVLLVMDYRVDPSAAEGEAVRLALAERNDDLLLFLLEAGADPGPLAGYDLYGRRPWGLLGAREGIWSRVPGYREAYPAALVRIRAVLAVVVPTTTLEYLEEAW